jgi:GT2 family glycosyltransferase
MSSDAPAVVVLVVAAGSDAGPSAGQRAEAFTEALAALAAQDYPNFSVLVAGAGELAPKVAACLPDAHFIALREGASFAEGANLGLQAVKGSAHVLICHADVALAPDALRLLVEEAYRSNAGFACPKLVSWKEPFHLLSVGLAADHWGGLHSLVEPGELDQGQHDAVREVFVAPTVAVLVRVDLWRALGGMSGGDLDLCWRAQLAGARVVVAPQAVARHLGTCGSQPSHRREVERLRTLWTCYSALALLVVVPAVLAFCALEMLWRLARPPNRHAGEPFLALYQSLRKPRELLAARRRAQSLRRVPDWALWNAQSRSGARLLAALSERVERAAASAAEHHKAQAAGAAMSPKRRHLISLGTASLGTASSATTRGAHWALPLGRKWLKLAVTCTGLLLLAGSRGVLGGPLPVISQLPSAHGGVGGWWQSWWSGPGIGGLDGVPFGPPALLVMGLLGIVCLGSAGTAVHIALLLPLAVGPLGAYFGARRLLGLAHRGSERGALAAGVLYAALPIAYDAIAKGHLGGLVSYAAAPWLLAGIAELPESQHPVRKFAGLVLIAAIVGAFAPATLLVAPVIGAALAAGPLLVGQSRGAHRHLLSGLAVGAGAFVLLLPWSAEISLAGTGRGHPGLAALLRFQSGPYGGSWLGWAFLAAAAVPVFIGRGERLAWAGRMWAVTTVFLALVWSWSAPGGAEELLAPGGAALAYSVALGVASVEEDLPGYRFGWRQFAPAFGVAAAVAAVLPLPAWAAGGRWDLPASGAEASYSYPPAGAGSSYRVLWVGAPGEIPLAPQGSAAGLRFGASLNGLPKAAQLWPGQPSRLARWVSLSLSWAQAGETTDLGHLLGLVGVRYVAVPVTRSDEGLLEVLAHQVDLHSVGIDPNYAVYENSAWVPVFGPAPPLVISAALAQTAWGAASLAVRPEPAGLQPKPTVSKAGALYGAVPPGTWGVEAAQPVRELSGAVGSVVWFVPRGARMVRLGEGEAHAAAAVTLALWAGALVALLWKKKRQEAEPIAADADRELVGAGKGP